MRSLRGRLALGVLVVLAVVLAIAGGEIARYVDRSERAALDERLERTAELSRATAVAAVAEGLPENDRRLDAVLGATDTSLRLLLGRATLLSTGERLPKEPGNRLRNGLRTFVVDGERYRTYVTSLREPGLGGLAKLEVTSSLHGVEQRQRRLERRLVLLGLITLVVSVAGTAFAAELVLRPLRRLRDVTSSIADDEDLDRRIPPDDGPAEVRSLAASFNAMLARLGRSSAARERALQSTRRFAADAGHELRTPLTSVQAVLDTVRAHPELDAAQRDEMLADALAQHGRLVALIDGLQALARGDAQPAEHVAIDLGELADEVVEDARRRHPQATIALHLPASSEAPVVVSGWPLGLRLLAQNLVENAVRHGGRPGQVRVTVEASPGGAAAGTGPLLRVEDDGPGVAPGDRERIFEPFTRAADTRVPGSGLGLALVAQQARVHDARIEVDDSPLGGAAFTVSFARSADYVAPRDAIGGTSP
jgi:two-component system sensor histidine kinase PrrB